MTNRHHHDSNHHHPEPWYDTPDGFVEFLKHESRLDAPQREAALARAVGVLDDEPRQIIDLGSGVGSDATMLAGRFPTAQVRALDISDVLLERVAAAAHTAGVHDRLTTHSIDLNGDWTHAVPQGIDLAWASLALHHLDDPARALRQVFATLRPGGVLVLTELQGEVHLTPACLGTGIAGLADRIAVALSAPAEYTSIDWQSLLEQAGFVSVSHSEYDFTADASTPDGVMYLQMKFRALRTRLADELSGEEVAKLDAVTTALAISGSGVPLTSTRSAWIAVRDRSST